MSNKVVTSISLPADVLKQAEKMAKDEHKSRSELIKEALKEYLARHQWQGVREEAAPYAQAKGMPNEEAVEKIIQEIRKSRREKDPLDEARERFKEKGFNGETIDDAVRWARKSKK